MYSDKVLELFKNPQNAYKMKNPSAVGVSASCGGGDVLELYLKIKDSVIVDASFLTFGCAAAIVSGSVATTMLKNMMLDEALKLSNKQIIEKIGGLPATKMHCSILVEEAIKNAIENYKGNSNNACGKNACKGSCRKLK